MQIIQKVFTKKSVFSSIIISILLLAYFAFITTQVDVTELDRNLILAEIGCCFLLVILKLHIPEKYQYYYNFIYIAFLSFFTMLVLDFFNGTFEHPFEDIKRSVYLKFFISFLVIFLLYFLCVSLIKDMRKACTVGFVIFVIIGVLGYVIYEFRGDRLLFADLLAVETALDVAGSYNIIPVKNLLFFGIISIFCGMVALSQIYKVKLPFSSRKRLICYLIFAFGIYGLYHTHFDNYYYSWVEAENSYPFSFFANLKFMELQPQRSYDKEEVIEMIEESKKATILPAAFNPEEEIKEDFPDYVEKNHTTHPNIIAIMNESFSDLDIFGESNTNSQIFTEINSMTNTISGNVYVDIRGGGTADSEYDFLTGNSTLILPINARPYQFYVNPGSLNLVTYLDSLNYNTMAIHPGNAFSWNRLAVYQSQFGFDEIIFDDKFGFDEYARNQMFRTDIVTYNKIFEKFSGDHTSPYFIFDVTIQNHGGYKLEYENLNRVQLNEDLPEEVVQFLSLMKRSDFDFGTLVDYFNHLDEPTVILMFGDHQPKFSVDFPSYIKDKSISNEKLQTLYQTPYVIAANYNLPVQDNLDLSINYLSSLLLECAGLEKSPINQYLTSLYQDIKVINRYGIVTKDNKYYSYDDLPKKYEDLLTEFRDFSYYNIIDQQITDFDLQNNKK